MMSEQVHDDGANEIGGDVNNVHACLSATINTIDPKCIMEGESMKLKSRLWEAYRVSKETARFWL